MAASGSSSGVRLAEVVAALSLATDLGRSQRVEHNLRSCLLALRLGGELGFDTVALRNTYYFALLRNLGCTSYAHEMAAIVGDDHALMAAFAGYDTAQPQEVLGKWVAFVRKRRLDEGASYLMLARWLAMGLTTMPAELKENFASHCEVAQRLAEQMDFPPPLVVALGQAFERWDGKGQPAGTKGEAIADCARLVALTEDMIVFHRLGGPEAAAHMARERAGQAYDPRLAEYFAGHATSLLAGLAEDPPWDTVIAGEPGDHSDLTDMELDRALLAAASFTDIKTPYSLNHSVRVSDLAARAGEHYGLPQAEIADLWRAGCLHELGRVAISNAILDKPGPLTEAEWERVRLHPYYTERVLARPERLAHWGALGATHHERLDGRGYHRGARAGSLSPAARVLAAANHYQALAEDRPYRKALNAEAAGEALRAQVRAGRLDGDAVAAVLAAAGQQKRTRPAEHPGGLSEREVEVLRLVARGRKTREIAAALVISEKTAGHHIQHIYDKIDVSTRAAATLYAMQHGLLDE